MADIEKEKIVARGKIFELVQTPQPDGRIFEVARRAPGVRVIIANHDDQTVLLTREYRHELKGWDYRLPGGKVFDTLTEYDAFRTSGKDMVTAAEQRAIAESSEEAGIIVKAAKLHKISTLGATVEWDLYIFVATDWSIDPNGQNLDEGEQIEANMWVKYSDAEVMIMDEKMQEDRVAMALLQWLHRSEP